MNLILAGALRSAGSFMFAAVVAVSSTRLAYVVALTEAKAY